MSVIYPISSAMLMEARLYCQDSLQHTMDYQGWGDQHEKRERITRGKFGELWVAEFCRLNQIECKKDRTSPYVSDDVDLVILGQRVDVKTTIHRSLLGQVSPGVIKKPCNYYCFVVTDKQCTWIDPIGFVSWEDYKNHAVFVAKGAIIPGTDYEQRFHQGSYFLPENSPIVYPFVETLLRYQDFSAGRKIKSPTVLIEESEINELYTQIKRIEHENKDRTSRLENGINTTNSLLTKLLDQTQSVIPLKRKKGNVVSINGLLFEDRP